MMSREFPELSYSRLLQDDVDLEYLGNHEVMGNSLDQQSMQNHHLHSMDRRCDTLSICESMYIGASGGGANSLQDDSSNVATPGPSGLYNPRKRKSSVHLSGSGKGTGSEECDDTEDDRSVRTTDDNKKQNHSEIEKRRRDKMNTYIQELTSMIPMCHAMSRKLDKLTVLRLAVQHLKSLRGAAHSYAEGRCKPSFLSDTDLKTLILKAADGFLFVVGCDRGRILYVSDSVSHVLNYSPSELLGQSWFDILHPKDVAKVKEQLSSSDLNPRERLIDAKTMLPVKTDVPQGASKLCPGARRSFFCRMKSRPFHSHTLKEESDGMSISSASSSGNRRKKHSSDKRFSVIHCSGYLKSWAGEGGPESGGGGQNSASDTNGGGEGETGGDGASLSCLVAVGRSLPRAHALPTSLGQPKCRKLLYMSRHATDGKFLFVDQRSTLVLGYLPQELLGTSMYEYFHPEDIPHLAEAHKTALLNGQRLKTLPYRMKCKGGGERGHITLQSEWTAFRNPWTKETEYLLSMNYIVNRSEDVFEASTSNVGSFDFMGRSNTNREMQKYINSQVECSKIGSQIVNEVLEVKRNMGGDSSEGSSPDNIVQQEQEISPPLQMPPINPPIPPTAFSLPPASPPNGALPGFNEVHPPSPSHPPPEASDEAAMAVIMSLLEADAGLGGPVDFSGLPWPLP